jgi:hypothetical protein
MDWCFAGGLHIYWENLNRNKFKAWHNRNAGFQPENLEILSFNEIFPLFVILIVGHSIGGLSFLCEIFHEDFVRNLTWEYLRRKFKWIFGD